MKFKIFGGLDCPDVVLAQLSIFSSFDAALASRFADHVTTVMLLSLVSGTGGKAMSAGDEEMGDGTNIKKASKEGGEQQSNKPAAVNEEFSAVDKVFMESIAADMDKVGLDRMKVAMALVGLHTLVANIVRFQVESDVALNELTMLGVSQEVAEVIVGCCSTSNHQTKDLKRAQLQRTLRLPSIRNPRVELIATAEDQEEEEQHQKVVFSFDVVPQGQPQPLRSSTAKRLTGGDIKRKEILMTMEQAKALLGELVAAREVLRSAQVAE